MLPRKPRYAHPEDAVNKADIVDRIAEGTGLTKLETEAVVNGFMTVVVEALKAGDSVELRGFGTFKAQHREPRNLRNPSTDEPMTLPERHVPTFKPSRHFRDEVDEALSK